MGLTIIISVDRAASSGTSTTDVETSDLKFKIKILQRIIRQKKGVKITILDWLV